MTRISIPSFPLYLVIPAQAGIQISHRAPWPMPKRGYVYILASQRNGTLYTGVTSDLVKRVWEHRQDLVESFTKRYGVHQLVYYETHAEIAEAIRREKRIKKWERAWKIRLIEQMNPDWRDLFESLSGNEGAGIQPGSGATDPGFPPARE